MTQLKKFTFYLQPIDAETVRTIAATQGVSDGELLRYVLTLGMRHLYGYTLTPVSKQGRPKRGSTT